METIGPDTNFWAMSSRQLAEHLAQVATAEPAALNNATRAEAAQLAEQWQAAEALPDGSAEESSHRRLRLDALQRRTIEILVCSHRTE